MEIEGAMGHRVTLEVDFKNGQYLEEVVEVLKLSGVKQLGEVSGEEGTENDIPIIRAK
jgi:hypothetical protein